MTKLFPALWMLLLLGGGTASAQLGVKTGFEGGFPFLLDRQGYYNAPSVGLVLGLSYRPPYNKLYPSLQVGVGTMQVPVTAPLYNDLNTQAVYYGLSASLHSVLYTTETKHASLLGGIGVTRVLPERGDVVTNATGVVGSLVYDGGSRWFPALHIGGEFFSRIWAERPLYFGVEGRLAYLYLYEKGSYFIETPFSRTAAGIDGHLLFPSVRLTFKYLLTADEYR